MTHFFEPLTQQLGAAATRILAVPALALGLSLSAWAAPVNLSPSTAAANITVGQTFSVDVWVSGAVDLYAFQFDIGFDSTLMEAQTVTEGAFLPSGGPTLFIEGTINNALGTVSDTAGVLNGLVPGVTGVGVLATFSFKVLAAGSSSITAFNWIGEDSNGFDILLASSRPLLVTTLPSAQPSTPISTPSTAALLAAAGLGLLLSRRPRSSPPPR